MKKWGNDTDGFRFGADVSSVRQQKSHEIAIFGRVMLLSFGYRCGVM